MCMKVEEDVDRLNFLGLLATGSGLRVDVGTIKLSVRSSGILAGSYISSDRVAKTWYSKNDTVTSWG